MPDLHANGYCMEVLGYTAALFIGISLGLIGGGGSLLTVPVMVYLFGVHPLLATSYSLFIVGSTSLVGALNNFKKGQVNIKASILFGASSITTVFITRKFILPVLPGEIFRIGKFIMTESLLTMLMFAGFMITASISIIRNTKIEREENECSECIRSGKLLGYGILIGTVTGLLGAGGGFLIIPALVILMKLPMRKAIGTSLFIIAINSLAGFAGDLGHFNIDWYFLLKITALAAVGIFIGGAASRRINDYQLKKGFGWFVLFMGIYILLKETLLN
jgi:uncharacterized protein